MRLVADTNVLISALLTRSKTFETIGREDLELLVPEFSLGEIEKHKEELRERMGIPAQEMEVALALILSHVKVMEKAQYANSLERARKTCPDPNDVPFFALALELGIPLWSNDKRLKTQKEVAVYNTAEVAGKLPHFRPL